MAVSGHAGERRLGPALGDALRSSRVEVNLEVTGGEGQDFGGREGRLKQTAVLNELAEQMADLSQEVKDFGGGDFETGDPLEAGRLRLTVDRLGCAASDYGQGGRSVFGIDIVKVIHPAELLPDGWIATKRDV